MDANLLKKWRELSDEIETGMLEWRQQNPKATFREIENELDQRLAHLRARMLTDVAVKSAAADWKTGEAAPQCPTCAEQLVSKGKKKRTLHTRGGQAIELKREYGICPGCGQALFPPG